MAGDSKPPLVTRFGGVTAPAPDVASIIPAMVTIIVIATLLPIDRRFMGLILRFCALSHHAQNYWEPDGFLHLGHTRVNDSVIPVCTH
jgi:hypothetical protein